MDWTKYIFTPETNEQKWAMIKTEINRVLSASDWTQIPGNLSLSEKAEQQALREAWIDLDDPNLDPDTIVFPQYPLMERL